MQAQEDLKKLKETEAYNPFGRGGAGAPLRGQDGQVGDVLGVQKPENSPKYCTAHPKSELCSTAGA